MGFFAGEHDQMVLFVECASPKWLSLVGEPVNNSVCWVSFFERVSLSYMVLFCRVSLSHMVLFAG